MAWGVRRGRAGTGVSLSLTHIRVHTRTHTHTHTHTPPLPPLLASNEDLEDFFCSKPVLLLSLPFYLFIYLFNTRTIFLEQF